MKPNHYARLLARRHYWNATDLIRGRLRRRECVQCGCRHWNGRQVALPLCRDCFTRLLEHERQVGIR